MHITKKWFSGDTGVLYVICLSEGAAPSVVQPLANFTARASEQNVLTCKINRGKPEADIKWCAFIVQSFAIFNC